MAITWESYLPEVAPHVSGAPYFEMVDAVRDAAIELATRSKILRSTLTAINVVSGQTDYTLTPPANTRVFQVIHARFDGSTMWPSSEEKLDELSDHWREGGSVWLRYYSTDPGVMSLAWSPDAAITGGLVVRVAYKPTETSDDGDDILYNDWNKAIANGAVAILKGTGDQEAKWYDPSGSVMWRKKFEAGLNDATHRAATGHTMTGRRVKMRPMA